MQEQLFVGRQSELEQLNRFLKRAMVGHGQVCFIVGDAGAGKTALIRHFLQQAFVAHPDLIAAVGSCNAQTGIGDPYLPFREALAMLIGDDSTQSSSKASLENTHRLRKIMARSVQVLVEIAPDLVGVLVPGAKVLGSAGRAVATKVGWMDQLERLASRPVGAVTEQSHIFEQYTAFLQHLSAKTPVVLFLDDLQWADGPSLGLLFHLARRIDSSRILILGAYRPNDVALGRGGERHPLEPIVHELTRYYGDISVDLDAIPDIASRAFVDALLDAEPNSLGEEFRQALFHQTGGHALFTVELIRSMQEQGDLVRDGNGRWAEGNSLDWTALPARVEGVIAERIGRLDDELRELLTVGSVEGQTFAAEVVAQVQALPEREAIRRLSNELQRQHRLVRDLGLARFTCLRLSLYAFVHTLFQQYLYADLDEIERACLHREMGEAIETLFAGQTEEVAAQLARHFEEGGLPAKAAAYRLQAGNRAHRMSAHQEATAHLGRGLELLSALPDGAERMQLELALQMALGTTLLATRGYAAPEVERAYTRARELCRALGDPPQTAPVLFGLCLFYMMHGELQRAREEGEQLLLLAEQARDIGHVVGIHFPLGEIFLMQGDLERSSWHLQQAVALYSPSRDRDLVHQQGQDPAVASLLFLSWALWLQGYPDQAAQKVEAALRLAQELNHPYTKGQAAVLASTFYQLVRQWPKCQAQAETALALAEQGHFRFLLAGGTMCRGSVLAQQGRIEDGIDILRQGLDAWEATGTQLALPYSHARLAEAYLLAGKQESGLQALDEPFSCVEEVWWLPEQQRLRAELLLLTPGNEAEAERALREALEAAHESGSRSLQLRGATSLARLLQRQGRGAEGLDLLAERYAWFTEGFDTADLEEARRLLDELGWDTGQRSQPRASRTTEVRAALPVSPH